MALINKLENIAAAIREKTGKTDLLTLEEMATEISEIETGGGGAELPEEAFKITGDCSYRFNSGGWDWFLRDYGNKVTTEKITNANYMFQTSQAEEIPFDLNFDNSSFIYSSYVFKDCIKLKAIKGKIVNLYPRALDEFFRSCNMLRELPEFINLNMDRIYTNSSGALDNIFTGCSSLRKIPEEFLKQLYSPSVTATYYCLFSGLSSLYALDEIKGLSPRYKSFTSNAFSGTFKACYRLKDIIFDVQEDGTPYVANWTAQTIDLSQYVGYFDTPVYEWWKYILITYSNSGITEDKRVVNDAQYQALKDDPDWFTDKVAYSRYNHTSAVNTINSLPDTSAYLAANGGTNTIKFTGSAGSATDGGAINTLTEEEIAVAAAKGWTVTLV